MECTESPRHGGDDEIKIKDQDSRLLADARCNERMKNLEQGSCSSLSSGTRACSSVCVLCLCVSALEEGLRKFITVHRCNKRPRTHYTIIRTSGRTVSNCRSLSGRSWGLQSRQQTGDSRQQPVRSLQPKQQRYMNTTTTACERTGRKSWRGPAERERVRESEDSGRSGERQRSEE